MPAPAPKQPDYTWLILLIIGYLLLSGGGIGGSKPTFVTDKASVLVVEESAERTKYTKDQLNVIQATDAASVKALVEGKGGRFFVLDKDNASALKDSEEWVKAAFAAAKDKPTPWIIGSNPKTGFSTALVTEAEAHKLAGGL